MIQDGQNIYDFAVEKYGTIENIFDVLDDNSLTFDSDLTSGMELNYNVFNKGDDKIKKLELTPVNFGESEFNFLSVLVESNETIIDESVGQGQSIFDITLERFGTIEEVFEIIDSNGFTFNTLLNSGQQLNISNFGKGNEDIKDFYKRDNIRPNNDQEYPLTGSQLDLLLQWPEFIDKDIVILPNLIIL